MNIFLLDLDLKKCAEYHNDKHVVKMIVETAQLLCGVHWLNKSIPPYKFTHKNNPLLNWVNSDLNNYYWLCELGLELCREYTYRYEKIHKTQEIIEWCVMNVPQIQDKTFTLPPLVMPTQYMSSNKVESYRTFYIKDKAGFSKWKKRNVPEWFK